MKVDYNVSPALFLLPLFPDSDLAHLDEAVSSISAQSDANWHLVIADESGGGAAESLTAFASDERITVISDAKNARNAAVHWAKEHKHAFILFHRAAEVSHPRRLELTRKIFAENAKADVVYDAAKPGKACEVKDYWLELGTKIGPSTFGAITAAKTELAKHNPVPAGHLAAAEWYTAMAYSGDGAVFFYSPDFPSTYLAPLPQMVCDAARSKMDDAAIKNAIDLYSSRRALSDKKRDEILMKFYLKQFETFFAAGEHDLARDQVRQIQKLYAKDIKID